MITRLSLILMMCVTFAAVKQQHAPWKEVSCKKVWKRYPHSCPKYYSIYAVNYLLISQSIWNNRISGNRSNYRAWSHAQQSRNKLRLFLKLYCSIFFSNVVISEELAAVYKYSWASTFDQLLKHFVAREVCGSASPLFRHDGDCDRNSNGYCRCSHCSACEALTPGTAVRNRNSPCSYPLFTPSNLWGEWTDHTNASSTIQRTVANSRPTLLTEFVF